MKVSARGIVVAAAVMACAGRNRPQEASTPTARPAPVVPTQPQGAPPRLLATIDVDGATFEVYAATLPDGGACWTYVSRGLAQAGRPELVMTVVARTDEDITRPPQESIAFLSAAAAVPASGAALTTWSWRELAPGLFGRDDLMAVAAVPARAPEGIAVPAGALTLVPLTHDELTVIQAHGVPRVANMLAWAQRQHPAPWWIERDRPTVVTEAQFAREAWGTTTARYEAGITLLLDVHGEPVLLPRSRKAPGGWYLEGTWRLRVTPASAAVLADYLKRLSVRSSTTIALAPDELSRASFVWIPGPGGPGGPQLFGNKTESQPAVVLVGFVPMKVHTGAQLFDDGVIIWLSWDQRDALVSALTSGQDVTIEPATEGMTPWRLEWKR